MAVSAGSISFSLNVPASKAPKKLQPRDRMITRSRKRTRAEFEATHADDN